MPVIPTRQIDDLRQMDMPIVPRYGSLPSNGFTMKCHDNESNNSSKSSNTDKFKLSKKIPLLENYSISKLSLGSSSTFQNANPADCDFVRFTYCDMNGIARHKSIPGRHANQFLKHGLQLSISTLSMGPRSDCANVTKVAEVGNPDVKVAPVSSTFHVVPWAGDVTQLVGSLLCEVQGPLAEVSPRYIARIQLERLSSMGFNLMGASEFEYQVLHADTLEPVFQQRDAFSSVAMGPLESLLSVIDHDLYEAGVDTETYQTEYGPGQIEISMRPVYGIKIADAGFIFKNAIKEIYEKNDLLATFMSRPFEKEIMNGTHFNHSVWGKNGENPMFDPSKADNLSDFARYWVGGLMKHGRAMTALCCPTVNCYRRMGRPCCPNRINWMLNSRNCIVRVKNAGESGTYIENRLPSGACNPYLALAATVAAGIDGVVNKIEPPNEDDECSKLVPMSLSEALQALKDDEEYVEILGKDFVDWFCRIKRETEIDLLKNSTYTSERDLYIRLM